MSTLDNMSAFERLALLSEEDRAAFFENFSDKEIEELMHSSKFRLRPKQMVPDSNESIVLFSAGRGFGKDVTLDTKILKSDGTWTTMGDIEVGDVILDEEGRPTTVTVVYPTRVPKKLYRLTFSDGTHIDASDTHEWVTWTHAERKNFARSDSPRMKNIVDTTQGYPTDWPVWTRHDRFGNTKNSGPKKRTTEDIVNSFTQGKRGDINHSIPLTKPVTGTERNLLLDPYLLGYWLGDGNSGTGIITVHKDDYPNLDLAIRDAGYLSSIVDSGNSYRVRIYGLSEHLSALHVLNNKHIPALYLSASIEQKKQLLAGILDSDGCVHAKSGHVEYVSVLPRLAEDVTLLVRSLGEKPVGKWSTTFLYGVQKKDRYRLTWRPKFNPFRLERKACRVHSLGSQALRNYHRMIVKFEELTPVPTRCITVDSPHSLYLAGEGLIPTHNSFALAHAIKDAALSAPNSYSIIAGRSLQDVRRIMVHGESGVYSVCTEEEKPEDQITKSQLLWPNGHISYLLSSENPESGRGVQAWRTFCDEVGSWPEPDPDSGDLGLFDNLRIATRLSHKGLEPKIVIATTPRRTGVLVNLLREAEEYPNRIKVITGTTMDNLANLPPSYLETLKAKYEGTTLWKQELLGQMLGTEDEGLWTQQMINDSRWLTESPWRRLPLRILAIDPSVAERPKDECGMMVLGSTTERDTTKRHAYLIEDVTVKGSPDVWVKAAVDACKKYNITHVVAEGNQGAALVKRAIQTENPNLQVHLVHASQGKVTRAEPTVLPYQQGRVHHVGFFEDLELQMTTYAASDKKNKRSPDRLDALVWGLTALLIDPPKGLGSGSVRMSTGGRGRTVPKSMHSTGYGTGRTYRDGLGSH